LVKLKLKLCNGSAKIEAIIEDYLVEWAEDRPNIDKAINNLEKALKEELLPRWWQFWR